MKIDLSRLYGKLVKRSRYFIGELEVEVIYENQDRFAVWYTCNRVWPFTFYEEEMPRGINCSDILPFER
jgi:hypothetical protein